MVIIRAPHGQHSRGVKVVRSRKGALELALLSFAWLAFLEAGIKDLSRSGRPLWGRAAPLASRAGPRRHTRNRPALRARSRFSPRTGFARLHLLR